MQHIYKDTQRPRKGPGCGSIADVVDTGSGGQPESATNKVEEDPGPRGTEGTDRQGACCRLWLRPLPTIVRDEGECGFLLDACASRTGGDL